MIGLRNKGATSGKVAKKKPIISKKNLIDLDASEKTEPVNIEFSGDKDNTAVLRNNAELNEAYVNYALVEDGSDTKFDQKNVNEDDSHIIPTIKGKPMPLKKPKLQPTTKDITLMDYDRPKSELKQEATEYKRVPPVSRKTAITPSINSECDTVLPAEDPNLVWTQSYEIQNQVSEMPLQRAISHKAQSMRRPPRNIEKDSSSFSPQKEEDTKEYTATIKKHGFNDREALALGDVDSLKLNAISLRPTHQRENIKVGLKKPSPIPGITEKSNQDIPVAESPLIQPSPKKPNSHQQYIDKGGQLNRLILNDNTLPAIVNQSEFYRLMSQGYASMAHNCFLDAILAEAISANLQGEVISQEITYSLLREFTFVEEHTIEEIARFNRLMKMQSLEQFSSEELIISAFLNRNNMIKTIDTRLISSVMNKDTSFSSILHFLNGDCIIDSETIAFILNAIIQGRLCSPKQFTELFSLHRLFPTILSLFILIEPEVIINEDFKELFCKALSQREVQIIYCLEFSVSRSGSNYIPNYFKLLPEIISYYLKEENIHLVERYLSFAQQNRNMCQSVCQDPAYIEQIRRLRIEYSDFLEKREGGQGQLELQNIGKNMFGFVQGVMSTFKAENNRVDSLTTSKKEEKYDCYYDETLKAWVIDGKVAVDDNADEKETPIETITETAPPPMMKPSAPKHHLSAKERRKRPKFVPM